MKVGSWTAERGLWTRQVRGTRVHPHHTTLGQKPDAGGPCGTAPPTRLLPSSSTEPLLLFVSGTARLTGEGLDAERDEMLSPDARLHGTQW